MWQMNRIDNIDIEYRGAYSMGISNYAITAVVRFEYLDDKTGGIVDNKILNIRIPQSVSNAWSTKRVANFMTELLFTEIDSELDLLNGIV
jgi:hypothetical protein